MWGGAVRRTYNSNNTPEYVSNILGPRRKYYVSERRAEKELISSNVEVILIGFPCPGPEDMQNNCRQDQVDMMHLKRTLQLSVFSLAMPLLWVIVPFDSNWNTFNIFSEYERSLKMTEIDLISSLGGVFGLFLGFSLMSFVEIVYWFFVVLSRRLIWGK